MRIRTPEPVNFLLVDDLEENLLSLEALLRHDDITMLKARTGTQALEYLLKHDIALAILDVQMPEMDGFELAELMRGMERTKRVPIIFLTAGSTDSSRRFRGYEAGAVDFLQKPVEADILRSKARIFYELRRQQRLLELQRDDLEEADRLKDEFIATLAHELRNPLAPIRNGLEILKRSSGSEQTKEVRDMMDRQLNHLVRLIDDLMDVSRISQGKIDLRMEAVSIQSAVSAAVESCSVLIESKRHTFITNVPADPVWVNADPTRLAQIISNLLNNAAKYTMDGGNIVLDVKQNGTSAIVSIQDNGIGIDPSMLDRVFEMFTQVNHHHELTKSGLGIGLSLVKQLVEMHDGSINVESEGTGKGSLFSFTMPTAKAPQETFTDKEMTTDEVKAVPLNVLVVDDNIPSAQTIGWMLELIGHVPVLAHDGIEAISKAKELLPDVILLDIGLPGMNGYEVCRTLCQDPDFKHTTFIAQTGWGQEKDKREAFAAGFDHHLVKPVNLQEFSTLLAKIKPRLAQD